MDRFPDLFTNGTLKLNFLAHDTEKNFFPDVQAYAAYLVCNKL